MKSGHHALRRLRRWHARFGVFAVVFFMLLTVSGIVLNHGSTLRLEGRKLHVAWLARWYGFKVEPPEGVYESGGHLLVWGNGLWVLDGKNIAEGVSRPVGMIGLSDALYIAAADALFAYGIDGLLIEKIPAAALPAVPIRAIGIKDRLLWLKTGGGIFASADGIAWRNVLANDVSWSVAQPVPLALQRKLAAHLLPGISVMQFIADVHSGRILGSRGPLVVDLMGLLLMVLGLSGSWVFLRSLRRHRPRARRPFVER